MLKAPSRRPRVAVALGRSCTAPACWRGGPPPPRRGDGAPGGRWPPHALFRHRAEGQPGFLVFWGSSHCFRLFHSEKPRMLSDLPEATHGARDPGLWCRGAGGLGGRGPGAGRPRSCSGTSLTLRAPMAGPGGPWLRPPCVDEESRGGTRGEHPSTAGERGAELGGRARPAGPTACAGPVLGAMPQGRGQPSSIPVSHVRPSPCVHSAREST